MKERIAERGRSVLRATLSAACDRKLINQLYALRNVHVHSLGQPDLKTRYAAEQRDALRGWAGGTP